MLETRHKVEELTYWIFTFLLRNLATEK